MMTIEELRRALASETAGLRIDLEAARVRRRARWIRRRQVLTVAATVLAVALAGGIYKASAPTAVQPAGPASTTLYYSDGETVLATFGEHGIGAAASTPIGLVVNHVLDELTHTNSSPLRGQSWDSIRSGRYAIITTIDQRAQKALEQSADETVAGSLMNGQPANLQAAGVVVEPGTGRVRAYYGGHDGAGADYAGIYQDSDGEWMGFGAHPPGSSFFPHTLAAALRGDISLNSQWEWMPHDMPGRTGSQQIRNASTCGTQPRGNPCTLLDSVRNELRVPLYAVTVSVTPAKVLQMARDAGIDWMWSDDRVRHRLVAGDMNTLAPAHFDTIVGLGQYPVTVLDQANAMATYAADGTRATAHFVERVDHNGETVFREVRLDGGSALTTAAAADLSYALSRNPAGKLPGRDSAVATGTWEYRPDPTQNAHAWTVGYTRNLAMAVWVGNAGPEQALIDKNGAKIWGSGLPASIYRTVMTAAHDSMDLPVLAFPAPAFAGRLDPPGSAS